MNPYVKNQKGVTLIELLAAISIFSIISIAIYSVWSFGLNSYNRIVIEGQLRDDADYIMTTIMNELHQLNPDEIISEPDKKMTFKSFQKHGINENTELVSGTFEETTLTISFENDQLIFTKKIGSSDETVVNISLDKTAITNESTITAKAIGDNKHYLIKVRLFLEHERADQNSNSKFGKLELSSQFSL